MSGSEGFGRPDLHQVQVTDELRPKDVVVLHPMQGFDANQPKPVDPVHEAKRIDQVSGPIGR